MLYNFLKNLQINLKLYKIYKVGRLKTMKRFIATRLLLVLNAAVLFANTAFTTVKEDLIYKSFVSTIVPKDYVDPFYENTKNNITIGIELLAIGQKETEWKMKANGTWPVCRNRDKEGNITSTDHGPLQLNSLNFEAFEKMFGEGLEKYKKNVDVYRMCLCIKYYQDIRHRSGTYNAFREYNGGPAYYRKPVTGVYANITSEYNNRFSKEYSLYKRSELARIEQEKLKKLLAKRSEAAKLKRGEIKKQLAKEPKEKSAILITDTQGKEIPKVPAKISDKMFYLKREDPCRFLIA